MSVNNTQPESAPSQPEPARKWPVRLIVAVLAGAAAVAAVRAWPDLADWLDPFTVVAALVLASFSDDS